MTLHIVIIYLTKLSQKANATCKKKEYILATFAEFKKNKYQSYPVNQIHLIN